MPRTMQLCPINYLLYTLLVPPYLQLLFVCFFDLLLLDGKLFLKYKKIKFQFKLFERQLKKLVMCHTIIRCRQSQVCRLKKLFQLRIS